MCPNSGLSKQSHSTPCLPGLHNWHTLPPCWSPKYASLLVSPERADFVFLWDAVGFLAAREPWPWGTLMLAWQEHLGEAWSGEVWSRAEAGPSKKPRGCHSSLLVPVVSTRLFPFIIPLALWRSNTLEFVDVGSGMRE